MPEAKRTLVKSGPELWAEVSDTGALARHLAPFGPIRITRTEPDSLVVWEGERASGAVRLAASGFGTRVTVEAEVAAQQPAPAAPSQPEPMVAVEPAPMAAVEAAPQPERKRGFWARLFRRAPAPPPAPEPAAAAPPPPPPPPAAPESAPVPVMPDDAALLVLTGMLDALGTAHHRPFSRT